ncbi:MAG: hypothetical protein ACKOW9_03095 [Candidatus Paceibacterota bacterium]
MGLESTPENENLLDKLNVSIKKLALTEIYRQSLLNDPKIREAFLSPLKLTEHENPSMAAEIAKGILATFPDEFAEQLTITDGGFLLNDNDIVTFGGVSLLKDELNRTWALYATGTPLQDTELTVNSIDSIINELNNDNDFGVWANLKEDDQSETEPGVILINGFTAPLEEWTYQADRLASHLTIQLSAYASHNILKQPQQSRTLSKIILQNMEYNESNPENNGKENIYQALNTYLTKLKAPMRHSLSVQELDNGYKIKVPLKSVTKHSQVEILLLDTEHSVLGKGLHLSAKLPGLLPRKSALKVAKKLNLSTGSSDNVHTSPKLNGPWSSIKTHHDTNWCSIAYKGFVPYTDPDFFTLADHIEGVVREVCTSWPNVDQEIMFNLIMEEDSDV